MLARIEEFHLTPVRPFHGVSWSTCVLLAWGPICTRPFQIGVILSRREERCSEEVETPVDPGATYVCAGPGSPMAGGPGRSARWLVLQFLAEVLGEEMFEDALRGAERPG